MRIGIIGSGNIGGTLADLLEQTGHDVRVGNSRGGTLEAADFGEIVVVAIPFKAYGDLPADRLDGKIVIDATNYYPARDGEIAAIDRDETTSSELLAEHVSGAHVVKAFNTMNAQDLEVEGRPPGNPDRLVMFVAGDDEVAKRHVADLIDELGFDVADTGSLAEGGRLQQPGSPVYNRPMTALEAHDVVSGG
jgi:predicted dinucleotide-binding enzyme